MTMQHILYIIAAVLLFRAAPAAGEPVRHDFYGGRLSVAVPAEWLHRSFDLGEVKTEQFNDRKRSIVVSFCLEERAGRNFSQYRDYRYDAARIEIWKPTDVKIEFPLAYPYACRVYDYAREGKNFGRFKKYLICVDGGSRYLTVTVQMKTEGMEAGLKTLNGVLASVRFAD